MINKPDTKSLLSGLYYFYNIIEQRLEKALPLTEEHNLSRPQIIILANLATGITRGSQLAKAIGVSRQAIQQQLAELARSDIIMQESDPGDRRANKIRLTNKGVRVTNNIADCASKIEQSLCKELGDSNVSELKRLLNLKFDEE
tara:strand:- start:393 stop:824 length:432 start_codon:yes stop_codon:yes gene_type:complete